MLGFGLNSGPTPNSQKWCISRLASRPVRDSLPAVGRGSTMRLRVNNGGQGDDGGLSKGPACGSWSGRHDYG